MNNHEDGIPVFLKVVVKFNKSFQEIIDELLKYPPENRAERVRILCLFGLVYLEEKNILKTTTGITSKQQPIVEPAQDHFSNEDGSDTFIETGQFIVTEKDNTQEARDSVLRKIKF
jgi:hypothetical protein